MQRRDFLAALSAGGTMVLAGCSQEKKARIVTTYTKGYRKYKAAEKTGNLAAAHPSHESKLYSDAASFLKPARDRFETAANLASGEAENICNEARKWCKFKQSEYHHLSKDQEQSALTASQRLIGLNVAHPKKLQGSITLIRQPGNATVGKVNPAPLPGETAQSPNETPTDKNRETATQTETSPKPKFLDGLSGDTLPNTSNEAIYKRNFTQSIYGNGTEFTLSVLKSLYSYYKDRPRVPDYGAYTSDIFDNNSIKRLSKEFKDYGDRKNHSARQIADHAIAWIQGMEYTQDKPATGYNEYPKYPLETIVDRGGDCEDTSILLAEVLRDLGYGTALLKLDQASHMAVGVAGEKDISGTYYNFNNKRYYYVETTGSGWRVGEMPDRVKSKGGQAEIVEINQSPSLAVQWKAFVPESGGLEMKATGHNVGEAPATNAKIQVDIETENGNVVAQAAESLPNIPPESNATKTLQMQPPADRALRIRVGALMGGTLADMDESAMVGPK